MLRQMLANKISGERRSGNVQTTLVFNLRLLTDICRNTSPPLLLLRRGSEQTLLGQADSFVKSELPTNFGKITFLQQSYEIENNLAILFLILTI